MCSDVRVHIPFQGAALPHIDMKCHVLSRLFPGKSNELQVNLASSHSVWVDNVDMTMM